MKVYLAGERENIEKSTGEPALWSQFVKRRLFSYYYHGCTNGNKPSSDLLASARRSLDLFLDSGAFTAFTQKVDIPLEKYAEFIHATGFWSTCSNLDDTSKNESQSYANQKALESLGVKVQPVFHTREDPRWLAKYLDEGYDYIFIGGMVPETTVWLMNWLDTLWGTYLLNPDGTARVKVHGFGLTDQSLMFRYPWYSVDSTSWLMTGIFGACLFMTPQGARKVVFSSSSPAAKKMDGWHYATLPMIQRKQVDQWLEKYGVTAQQCSEHYRYRDAVNAATFQEMENLGTHRFLRTQQGLFDA